MRRRELLETLQFEGITEPRVLEALATVPREEFVSPELQSLAYANRPLPIGQGQSVSQPYIVARVTSLAFLRQSSRVLELGTGCGYQSAVLSLLAEEVDTVEVLPELAEQVRHTLQRLGYAERIRFRVGDGHRGLPEGAPFDAIVVTAAPADVPPALTEANRRENASELSFGSVVFFRRQKLRKQLTARTGDAGRCWVEMAWRMHLIHFHDHSSSRTHVSSREDHCCGPADGRSARFRKDARNSPPSSDAGREGRGAGVYVRLAQP